MSRLIKSVVIALAVSFSGVSVYAQKGTFDGKRIKETKEWKVEGKKKRIDHVTKYNEKGKKVEEIEYSSLGEQKERITYEYDANGKCVKEFRYDEFNKLDKTITIEYHSNGKKKSETVFDTKGKQKYVKEFEYILQ